MSTDDSERLQAAHSSQTGRRGHPEIGSQVAQGTSIVLLQQHQQSPISSIERRRGHSMKQMEQVIAA